MADLPAARSKRALIGTRLALALTLFAASSYAQEPSSVAENAETSQAPTGKSATDDSPSLSPEAEAEAAADLATAKLHFTNGVELIADKNYQDAFRQFQLASEKSGGSWKVLGNLGLCALKLERDGEALQYYGKYLKKGGEEVDPQERLHIQRELLLIEGNMTSVSLSSTEENVRVTVKRQGSSAPAQIYELKGAQTVLGLRAGSLVITARSGETQRTWEAVLQAGESPSHQFNFSEVTPAVAAPAASAPAAALQDTPPQSTGPNTLRLAGYITTGVGVLALGGGVVTGLISQSKEQDALDNCINDICEEIGQDDFDSAASMATIANVLYITGGVLSAAGITLVILGDNKTETLATNNALGLATLKLTPAPTLGGGGFFASGTF